MIIINNDINDNNNNIANYKDDNFDKFVILVQYEFMKKN